MMKKYSIHKLLTVIGCMVLIAAMALTITGCGSKNPSPTVSQTKEPSSDVSATVLGEGKLIYYFIAVDLEGNETKFEIHTDEEMVGAALISHGLIAGDASSYGLYVKTVNGITLDYEKDGKYWSLLIDGEYAMTGVDMTEAAAGSTYTLLPAELPYARCFIAAG